MSQNVTPVVRYLGGETGHRSFFGGTHSRTRIALLALFMISGLILTPLIGWPGLAIAVGGCGLTFLVTARTHRGSIMDRHRKRARWKHRTRTGTTRYQPFDVAAWDQAEQALTDATHTRGTTSKETAAAARQTLAALRANPDGADGMGWLQCGRGEPGIAWHAPAGERSYLSVTFSVTGQLRGIESATVMAQAAEGWGLFLAGRAVPSVLADTVQTTTRILPADSALQEFWVLNSLDDSVPPDAIRSYEDVLRLTGEDAMVQRHYITVSWPITSTFTDTAAKYGPDRDGWRNLMRTEIAATVRGLTEARMGQVEPLTARQLGAVMLHQQNPSRPIDFVADVHPTRLGEASRDEFSAHVVAGQNPTTGAPTEWWHRTAAVRAEAVATGPRTPLWVLDLLIGRDIQVIRSVSFHLRLVPAMEAKIAARQDLVRDTAERMSRVQAGKFDTDDTVVAMTAAQRRRDDLTAGTHHHGANWVGYITISTPTRDELSQASRRLEDVCATSLGVDRLDWQDSYQAAASGTTWPIGRGLATPTTGMSAHLYRKLAGRTEKDALT
ncbi:hypothetical protein [Marisediminicola senii]|uniref:hypothetical protein n=1 Tax=Marisediminicola senii TaxID=2711233 RepID=UPI0013ED8D6F|nr:hypothetical protein [Marisediminicola senii]